VFLKPYSDHNGFFVDNWSVFIKPGVVHMYPETQWFEKNIWSTENNRANFQRKNLLF